MDSQLLNGMTIDVEEHFQVSAFAGVIEPGSWDSMSSRVEPNTERVLDLLDERSVKATFFILGWIGERHRSLVRRIAERGHEIGSHGYSHTLVYRQRPQEFREEALRSKSILEDAAGRRVLGYRAASFSIGRENLWALDVLSELGFLYDSSLFPVHHDRYGIPGAPRTIYRVRTANGGSILEVPPSTVRIGKLVLPVGGGGYLRLYPSLLTRWAIRRLNRAERMPAVVYLHPWEVDPEQPRIRAPWRTRMRHYCRLHSTAGKLRSLLASFRFGALHEVIARQPQLPERSLA
jgi:polysaccharide deacetylase family protein (PEP-CTERM system associated)